MNKLTDRIKCHIFTAVHNKSTNPRKTDLLHFLFICTILIRIASGDDTIKLFFWKENLRAEDLFRLDEARFRLGAFNLAIDKMRGKGGVFRYADNIDKLLMLFGTLGSIGHGLIIPVLMFVLSRLIDTYGNVQTQSKSSAHRVEDKVWKN